jgi:hypothetical protein
VATLAVSGLFQKTGFENQRAALGERGSVAVFHHQSSRILANILRALRNRQNSSQPIARLCRIAEPTIGLSPQFFEGKLRFRDQKLDLGNQLALTLERCIVNIDRF